MKNRVIIGTRTSKLALYQAFKVEKELKKNFPDLEVEIKKIKTKGDILLDKPLDRSLDKGYFVKEIQELLIQNKIDIAVHSLKDLPVEKIDELEINAVLERAVGGIAELITKPGEINLDFADVKSVMSNAGSTMRGSGIGEG